MKCNLVILNYNDSIRALKLGLKCINYSSIENVIIVDNGSTDDSYEYLQKNLINVNNIILIQSSKNGGFAYGNNIGARYACEELSEKYILFANTDTIFDNKSIEDCLYYLEKEEDLALISMRIKDIKGNEEISCWNKRTYFDFLLSNFYLYRSRIAPPLESAKIHESDFQYVEHVRGSFMLFKAKYLYDIDYFDENTFLYFEEEIISERLRSKGYKIGLLTTQFYIHNHIGSNDSKYLNKVFYSSLYYYLQKYCNVNFFQIQVLKLAVTYKEFEWNYIISPLKKLKRFFNK